MLPVSAQTTSSADRRALIIASVLLGFAAAMLVALVLPLGIAEAPGLSWLEGAAAPGLGWGEPFRHLIAPIAASDRPSVALLAAAVVLKLVPGIGTLLALRLPDVLAAGLVTACLARLAKSRSAGALAVLGFLASPALWAAVAGAPGLVVDGAAGLVFYAVVRASAARPGPGALLAALIALAVLIGNGSGVYAVAIGFGAWLHAGLARGEWRLFSSLRLTVFAGLVIAALTLIDVLGLPAWARCMALYRALDTAIDRSGLAMPPTIIAAGVLVPSLVALVETVRRPAGAAGRLALILGIGALVLAAAPSTSPLAMTALAPVAVLWWSTPLVTVEPRDRSFWFGCLYVSAGAVVVAALLLVGRGEPATSAALVWASRAVAIGLTLAAMVAIAASWRARRVAPAIAVALTLAGVIAGGSLWLAAPQQLLSQRGYDRQLAHALAPLSSRPIAVLAPVEAPLWRAELGRPVFVAASVPALCRWAAARDIAPAPLALVRPGATDPVLGRFGRAHLLLQSAGTPRTSVMVIELGTNAAHDCRAGR